MENVYFIYDEFISQGDIKVIIAETGKLIKQYFQNKADQLLAVSKQAICEHSGLKGSHREDLVKIYLGEIMPKRFEIGQGMIYGPFNRSTETDIVIWDSYNFPNLKMNGHSMYFAESVQAAIEVKTNYNLETEEDVVYKTEALKSIVMQHRDTLDNKLFHIEQRIESIMKDTIYEGCLSSMQTITSCAIFINGGKNFNLEVLKKYDEIEIQWPDIVLFLAEGKITVKCIDENEKSKIRLYDAGKDALLLFTKYLIEVLSQQVVLVEGMLYFDGYIAKELEDIAYTEIEYCQYRPSRGFKHAVFSK